MMIRLRAALDEALRGLRLRRRRALLTGVGIALAAAMLSAAVVVADGLGLGFGRSAKAADLPDLIVRFDNEPVSLVDQRIRSLPDVAGYATREELTNVGIAAGHDLRRDDAVAEVVSPSVPASPARRGYAVVSGHQLADRGSQILLEQAFAQSFQLTVGSTVFIRGLGPERVVGLVQAPDNVGYPLAKPRFYLSQPALDARFGPRSSPKVDYAEVWLRDPRSINEVLVQARSSSFGLRGLRFATKAGVRVLLDQAAGIVIDLLVALSVIALITAGAMLAASARAEVQRRLTIIGVQRALGAPRSQVTLAHATERCSSPLPPPWSGAAPGSWPPSVRRAICCRCSTSRCRRRR